MENTLKQIEEKTKSMPWFQLGEANYILFYKTSQGFCLDFLKTDEEKLKSIVLKESDNHQDDLFNIRYLLQNIVKHTKNKKIIIFNSENVFEQNYIFINNSLKEDLEKNNHFMEDCYLSFMLSDLRFDGVEFEDLSDNLEKPTKELHFWYFVEFMKNAFEKEYEIKDFDGTSFLSHYYMTFIYCVMNEKPIINLKEYGNTFKQGLLKGEKTKSIVTLCPEKILEKLDKEFSNIFELIKKENTPFNVIFDFYSTKNLKDKLTLKI